MAIPSESPATDGEEILMPPERLPAPTFAVGRSREPTHDPTRDGSQARIFLTTAPCTSVRR